VALNSKFIGAHVSTEGGVENAPINAAKIGAKAFAMFTKNQKRWTSPPFSQKSIDNFKTNLNLSGIAPDMVLTHDSYLINLANPDPEKRAKSLEAFLDEAQRVEQLGLTLLNFHPGAHLNGMTEDQAIRLVADGINLVQSTYKSVTPVIENTAGQGSNIGYRFEHLRDIIELVNDKSRVGVCIDTCHTFAAGYDIRDTENFNKTFMIFDEIVGFKYLKGVHINDSKSQLGSRLDRHHSIGLGLLGSAFFSILMNDNRFNNIPIILETIDDSLWKQEIDYLYSLLS